MKFLLYISILAKISKVLMAMNSISKKNLTRAYRLAFLMLMLLVGGIVHAEGGCPPGMIPEGGPGVSSCRPIPNYNQSGSQGHWIHQWGAIATDGPGGHLGVATNMSSKEEAEQTSLAGCMSKGGTSCHVEVAYHDQCAAMVVGDTGHNSGNAATIAEAVSYGIQVCRDAGDTNCHAYYTACSLSKLVQ